MDRSGVDALDGQRDALAAADAQCDDAAFAAVESGRADAAVSNNWYGQYNAGRFGLVETPVVFLPSRLHIVAAQGKHADWLAAIDRHLRQWQGDNGSVYFEILREWRSKTEMAATPLRVWVTLGGVGLLALLALRAAQR